MPPLNPSKLSDEELERLIAKKFSLVNLAVLFLIVSTLTYYKSAFFAFFIIVFYFVYFYHFKSHLAMRKFMRGYGASHNLHYQGVLDTGALTGRLFRHSRSAVEHTLCGEYKGFPLKLFYYNYTVQQGKRSRRYDFTVSEMTIKDLAFPYLLLLNKKMWQYQDTDQFGDDKDVKVPLEDLTKNFHLFTTNNYELEALQICSQELLSIIDGSPVRLSVEFGNDKIYLYTDKRVTKREDLDALVTSSQKIIDISGAFLLRLKDDYEALHEVYRSK